MTEKDLVWIRSAGRCAICNKYLLNEDLGGVVPLGENAHIVGQKQSARSPRGDHDLSLEDRDKAENLVLLCRDQHKAIDNSKTMALFSVEQLRQIKQEHEEQIRHITGLRKEQRTAVLRLVGNVRGAAPELNRTSAAKATITSSSRFPFYPLSIYNAGVEIDLRSLADEGSESYYKAACDIIDREVRKLEEGVRSGHVLHVSVFAFARIPLLIYLGHKLDDTYPVDIYQRHRSTDGWEWDRAAPEVSYKHEKLNHLETEEAVLLLNVSGTIPPEDVPDALKGLATYRVSPRSGTPGTGSLKCRKTLSNFEATFRDLLARFEQQRIKNVHLIAAIPLSVGLVIGKTLNLDVNPSLVVYELNDGVREPTLEIRR